MPQCSSGGCLNVDFVTIPFYPLSALSAQRAWLLQAWSQTADVPHAHSLKPTVQPDDLGEMDLDAYNCISSAGAQWAW